MKRGLGVIGVLFLVLSLVVSACAPAAPAPEKPATPKPAEAKPAAEKATPGKAAAPKPAEKAAEARPPIKIGYLTALTGTLAGEGTDLRDGFLLYLEQKGNTLAGRKVEVIVEDDEAKPDVGLTKAKKLVERDKVNMLMGIMSSAVAYGLAEYVKQQKLILFITNAGADDLTQRMASPYIFRNGFTVSNITHPFGEWAYKKGYRKAAILGSDFAAGYESVGGFARTFTEMGGTIIQELYPPLGVPDPSPFITAVKTEADVLYVFQAGADALRFVQRYGEYGMHKKVPLIGQYSLTDDPLLPQQGEAAIGVISIGPWYSALPAASNKAFLEAFKKRFNRDAITQTEAGYNAGMILEKALQSTNGNIEDTDAFIKALEKVEVADAPRGPLKFDKYHMTVMNMYVAEVKKVDGKPANVIFDTYKDVSQFWKWSPEDFMKLPRYADMKNKWVK